MQNHLWRLLAIVAFASAFTSVSARADDEGYYTFTSALSTPNSSFCLNVPGSDYQPGKRVALIGCTKTPEPDLRARERQQSDGGRALPRRSRRQSRPAARRRRPGGAGRMRRQRSPGVGARSVHQQRFLVRHRGSERPVRHGRRSDRGAAGRCWSWRNAPRCRTRAGSRAGRHGRCRSPKAAAYVGGYGEYAEPEYYWYTGHRYCWYDGGWHGGGLVLVRRQLP